MRNLIHALKTSKRLMINPSIAKAYVESVEEIKITAETNAADVKEILKMMFGEQPEMEIVGKTAIIPIKGVIGRGLSDIEKMCNAVDVNDITQNLHDAIHNPQVEKIVFDVDSPGGNTDGLEELAEKIYNCPKFTESFSENGVHSAAYYLASQAKRFSVTKSAEVGSVGVFMAFPDVSEAYAMEGVKMEVIQSGKYKAIGLEGTSLSNEQREYLQNDVDEGHAEFKSAVKRRRTFVKDEDMEGQSFGAKKAAEKGFVTGIVNSIGDVVISDYA
jgi:signal peptide peptidase SppA